MNIQFKWDNNTDHLNVYIFTLKTKPPIRINLIDI